eukprot:gene19009-biopygen3977
MWHLVKLYPTSCGIMGHGVAPQRTSCDIIIMGHHVELYPTSCDIMWYHVASCGIDRDATAGGSIPRNVASCDMYAAMWHLALHDVTSMGHNMEHRMLWVTTTTCDAA